MAYEQNLGQIQEKSPVGAGIDVEGQAGNGFDVQKAVETGESAVELAKRYHSSAKAIHWTELTKTFKAVPSRWMKLTQNADLQHKPRGACINETVSKLKKGQLVKVLAQGTTAESCGPSWLFGGLLGLFPGPPVANSFVKTTLDINREGYVRTAELTPVDMGPELDFDPTPRDTMSETDRERLDRVAAEMYGTTAAPKKKLPILPLLGIGYFLLK